METLEAIKKRYSCRSFTGDQIPEKALEEILKAGMAAPVLSISLGYAMSDEAPKEHTISVSRI